jgi:hypothetical protein
MKSLFATPSWRAGRVRLADYAELMALKSSRGKASSGDLIATFDRREDEDEDRFEHPVEEAFDEIADRIAHLGEFSERYPFQLEQDEIRLRSDALKNDDGWLYIFLLLSTALNMRDERKHAGLDGADLFEGLSSEVGLRYFGRVEDSRTKTRVFGTSRCNWPEDVDEELEDTSKFKAAVDSLCKELGEGGFFRPKTDNRLTARDDKLDVVVWRDFSDRRTSKLIAFGQCKTGTHWLHELPRLNPQSFCNRWLDTPLASPALKMFFLTDRIAGELTHNAYEAGILFDRCRVLDYAHDLPKDLLKKCAKWSRAALAAQGVRLK